jgi:hypothetical protein
MTSDLFKNNFLKPSGTGRIVCSAVTFHSHGGLDICSNQLTPECFLQKARIKNTSIDKFTQHTFIKGPNAGYCELCDGNSNTVAMLYLSPEG